MNIRNVHYISDLSRFFSNIQFLINYGILLFKFLDPTITNGISVSQLKNLSFNLEVSFAHNQVRVSYYNLLRLLFYQLSLNNKD